MAQPQPDRLTVEDYGALPDDGQRYEILDGILEVTPSPTFEHQTITARLLRILESHCSAHRLGQVVSAPMDVILSNDTVCQPDLIFIRTERLSEIVRDRIYGSPDLVIEILSPSTNARDLTIKKQLYARSGIPEYWVVDPKAASIRKFTLEGRVYGLPLTVNRGELLTTAVVPGLDIVVDDIFG